MKLFVFFCLNFTFVSAFLTCQRVTPVYCPSGFGCSICQERCKSDADCPSGGSCVYGECIALKRRFFRSVNETAAAALKVLAEQQKNCSENIHCTGFETCDNGKCGRIISSGVKNTDDNLKYKCMSICVEGPEKPPLDCFKNYPNCRFDHECDHHYFCIEEKCQRVGNLDDSIVSGKNLFKI